MRILNIVTPPPKKEKELVAPALHLRRSKKEKEAVEPTLDLWHQKKEELLSPSRGHLRFHRAKKEKLFISLSSPPKQLA
jgi:hypothetical protein